MQLQVFVPKSSNNLRPFYPVAIPAGKAQPIEQEPEWIDIDQYLRGDQDVVYVRATGLSMKAKYEAGIDDGDILAVKRTGFAEPGDVVIAEVNGEFTVKRLKHHTHGLYLVPANDDYPIRRVERSDSFSVWAVVSYVIHKMKKAA